MQQPPPPPQFGYFYPPPPPRKPPTDIRKVMRIVVLVCCTPALILVIAAAVSLWREKKHDLIVFDNRLDSTVDIMVDGKKVDSFKAHQDWGNVVTIPAGAKHIEVMSGGKLVSGIDVAFPPPGRDGRGFRGLYVIGPSRHYVLAKVPYYEKMPNPPVFATKTPLPLPSPLAELPRDLDSFEMDIDGVFLQSEKVQGGTEVYWKRHLCSLDDDGKVGCHGYPQRD